MVQDLLSTPFYAGLETAFRETYQNEPDMVDCMMDVVKEEELHKKFISWNTLTDPNKMNQELVNYLNVDELMCRISLAFGMSVWMVIVIGIVILGLCCFCCVKTLM